MAKKENPKSLHSRTRQAYEDLGLTTNSHDLLRLVLDHLKGMIGEEDFIRRNYVKTAGSMLLAGGSLTPAVIKNIIILYEVFKLTHKPIAQIMSGDNGLRQEGIGKLESNWKLQAHLLPWQKAAVEQEAQVLAAIRESGGDLSKVNLHKLLQTDSARDTEAPPASIRQLRIVRDVLDDLRADDAHSPWRIVNRLIEIGDITFAEKRLDDLRTDEEPGVTIEAYLRARIALARFHKKRRDAFVNRMLAGEAEPLSGTEQAYAQTAHEDEGDAEREYSKVVDQCMIAWRAILRRPADERARIVAGLGKEMSSAIEEIIAHLLRWYGPRATRWGSDDAAWDSTASPRGPEDRAALLAAAKAVENSWLLSAASGSHFRAYAAHIMQKLDPGSEATVEMAAGLRRSLIAQEQQTLTGESWLDPVVAPLVEEDDALTEEIFQARFAALEAAHSRARARPAFREIVATLGRDGPDAAWLHLKRLKAEGRLPQDRDAKIIARFTVGRLEYAIARLIVEGKAAAVRDGIETDWSQPPHMRVRCISVALAERGLSALPEDVLDIASDQSLYEEYIRIEPLDEFGDDEPWDQDWERDHQLFKNEIFLLMHYPKRNWRDKTSSWT